MFSKGKMDTKQIAVVLLIVAIVLSVITIFVASNNDSDKFEPAQSSGTNYIYERTNTGPASGGVGFEISGGTG